MRKLGLLLCLCALACGTPPEWPPPVPFVDPTGETEVWGYRDVDGTVAIPPRYLVAEPFSAQGLAAVADSSGWAYIDVRGRTVIRPFIVDNGPDPFQDGLARFEEEGRFGFFDTTGAVVIPAQLDFAAPFEEGRAAFCRGCNPRIEGEHTAYVGGQWGYLDTAGAVVISAQFDTARPFEAGTARVQVDGTWHRIDPSGTILD